MELKDFISTALLAIDKGVEQAIKQREPKSLARFNPIWSDRSDKNWSDYVHPIEFDVAVTVVEKKNKDGRGGLKVGVLEIAGGGSKANERSTVNRIKFILPVLLAGQPTESDMK
jgi:hypothetical protein